MRALARTDRYFRFSGNLSWVLCLLVSLPMWTVPSDSAAQVSAESGEYERKTIVYVPTAMSEGPARLSKEDAKSYIVGIGLTLANPRFKFFSIPEAQTNQFVKAASGKVVSGYSLVEAVNATIMPELKKIMDSQQLVLAQQYEGEADRQSFIETKAKEIGIDASMIQKVYDFSFIAVPFLTSWTPGSKKEPARLSGGVYWYRVERLVDGSMTAIYDSSTEALGGQGKFYDKKENPFVKCNESFQTNLDLALRARPEFQMATQVLVVGRFVMHLTIGRESGIRVDDLYRVYEDVEEAYSPSVFKRVERGFVRISKLEKPEEGQIARSEARSVTAGRVSKGMLLKEIPCSGSEVQICAYYLPYHISPGTLTKGSDVYMRIQSGGDKAAYAAMLGYFHNLASTGESQAYLGARLYLGLTNMGGSYFNDRYGEDHSLVFGGELGLDKRSYMGPVGLNLGIHYGLTWFMNTTSDDTGKMPYKDTEVSSLKSGPLATGGISFWLRPLYQIHFVAEKRWMGERTDWKIRLNKSEKSIDPGQYPKITFDSFAFRFYITRRLGRVGI